MENLNYLREILSQLEWKVDHVAEFEDSYLVTVTAGDHFLSSDTIADLNNRGCRFHVSSFDMFFGVDK